MSGDMLASVYDKDGIALDVFGKGIRVQLKSDITSMTVPAAVQYIRTSGFAQAGLGGATYVRVSSEPSHPGKAQSADGAWWVIAEAVIDARMLGVVVGSNADATMAAAIATASALKAPLLIPAGIFIFTEEVNFSALIGGKIVLSGQVVFDFTNATSAPNFPDQAHVYVGGAPLYPLQDLTVDVIQGDSMLRFYSASHGVQVDDRFCIYSSVLWNGARPAYTSGEWLQALSVYGTDVTLHAGTYAAYAKGAIDLYKHPNKPITIEGGTLTIRESVANGFDGIAGFRADRIVDSDFSAIRPTNSLYAGLMLNQCIGIYGDGYKVCQRDVASGNAYGVVFSNCQDCLIEGVFEGGRHAIAIGGLTGVGAVVNRNIYTIGTHRNSSDAGPGIGAWNSHGNSEFCGASGTFDGGITAGGDHMRFRGRIRTWAVQRGWAIFVVENLGFNFDFESMEIVGTGDPSALWYTGVVDFCSQSSSGMNAYTTRGGRINLNNVKFECPNASILFSIGNNGYTTAEKVILTMEGASWRSSTVANPVVIATQKKAQTRCLDELYLHGFINDAGGGYSMDSDPLVAGWRSAGQLSLSTSTSVTYAVGTAIFTTRAPKAPHVISFFPEGVVGGVACDAFQGGSTTQGLTLGLKTSAGANFAAATSAIVKYLAALDEC